MSKLLPVQTITFIKPIVFGLALLMVMVSSSFAQTNPASVEMFGKKFKSLESLAVGKWWKIKPRKLHKMNLDVPRDQVCAFAVYAHDNGTLKLTAQMFPLKPEEERVARLEFKQTDGSWSEVGKEKIFELGWSAHFQIDNWDNSKDVAYRVRHGADAQFEGLIRKDPIDKETIVVGNLSCNCLLYTSPSPRDLSTSRMPSSA